MAVQADQSYTQPGPDQTDYQYRRNSEDVQRQLEEYLQGSLHLSEQHCTPALLNLRYLSINEGFHAGKSWSFKFLSNGGQQVLMTPKEMRTDLAVNRQIIKTI